MTSEQRVQALRNFNTLNKALASASLADVRALLELEQRGEPYPGELTNTTRPRDYVLRRLRQKRRALLAASEEEQVEGGSDDS